MGVETTKISGAAYHDPSIVARFWSKVIKKGSSGCWLWQASQRNKGYGAFAYTWDGKSIHDRAHRFSWRLHCGEIPTGLYVLHKCDVPQCVNPDHLFLGTIADNNRDMILKGRHVKGGTHCGAGKYLRGEDWYAAHPTRRRTPRVHIHRTRVHIHRIRLRKTYLRGEEHHQAKLNVDVIREIRRDHRDGMSFSQLSKKHGISIGHAWRIVHRKAWKHVDG